MTADADSDLPEDTSTPEEAAAPEEKPAPKKPAAKRRAPAKKATPKSGTAKENAVAAAEKAMAEKDDAQKAADDSSQADAKEPETQTPADEAAAEPEATEKPENTETGGSEAAAAGPTAAAKAKEKLAEADWGYRGRALLRGIMMIFAAIALEISVAIVYVLAFVQFIYTLITTEKLGAATEFSARLGVYVRQLLDFICYRKDDVLFPLAPFPELPEEETDESTDSES